MRSPVWSVCLLSGMIWGIMLMLMGHVCECSSQEVQVDDTGAKTGEETVTGTIHGQISDFQRYVKLFEHNRAIQVDAVKSLLKSKVKHDAKYKFTDTMVTKIFQIIVEAKINLTEWGYMPGDEWPTNETVREAASKVFENVAMFGDLVLKLPDITHAIYDKNKQWEFLIGWAVWFSMESKVFQGPHEKLLNLMSQELGLIPKDENFINPYSEMEFLKEAQELEKSMMEKRKKEKSEKVKKKSKDTKAKRKGPKLSGVSHTEL